MNNKHARKRPPRKGEGRPRKYKDAMKRTQVFLTEGQKKTARHLSPAGAVSDGVQVALDFCRKYHPFFKELSV